jgi:hypothetical protein
VGGCRSKAETLPPPSATRGGAQCSLPHSHHPPLLRARREIIPSCSGVTGTTEGGGRIEPLARATPPPPVRGERRGYAHRASCSGSAPTLFPFPLAGCRVVPTPPPGKKMWGDRRWPICHSWVAAGESSSQLVVLVLRPRRGVLAGRVREGAAAAVKTNPGRELRHCVRRQFLRFLLGRASDRPWGPSHRRLNHGSSKEETRKLARHRDKGCKCRKTFGAPCVERAGLFSAASRRGAGRRCAGRPCGGSIARGVSVLAGRVIEGSAAAVKTNPSCEMRPCMGQQFLRNHRA